MELAEESDEGRKLRPSDFWPFIDLLALCGLCARACSAYHARYLSHYALFRMCVNGSCIAEAEDGSRYCSEHAFLRLASGATSTLAEDMESTVVGSSDGGPVHRPRDEAERLLRQSMTESRHNSLDEALATMRASAHADSPHRPLCDLTLPPMVSVDEDAANVDACSLGSLASFTKCSAALSGTASGSPWLAHLRDETLNQAWIGIHRGCYYLIVPDVTCDPPMFRLCSEGDGLQRALAMAGSVMRTDRDFRSTNLRAIGLRYPLRGALSEPLSRHPKLDGYSREPGALLADFGVVRLASEGSSEPPDLGNREVAQAPAQVRAPPELAEKEHLWACQVARLLVRAVLAILLAANSMQQANDIVEYLQAVKRRLNNGRDNGAHFARCTNMLDTVFTKHILAGHRVFADHASLPTMFSDRYHPKSGAADISQHCAVGSPFLRIATGMMAGAYVKAAAGFVADSREPKWSADVQQALLLTAQVLLALSDRLEE
jgi:hypothetical protein